MLTLLILTLLVVTGLEMDRAVRVEATLAGNFRDLTQASYIAQSRVEVARVLIQSDNPAYDGLDDGWAQFESFALLSSGFFPEGSFGGRITDENSRFNPNGVLDPYGNINLKKREQLERLPKLAIVLDDWMDENAIDATAIRCWTSIQENYGINVCTVMSMMSERLMPSACEVDIAGTASMYALSLAAGIAVRRALSDIGCTDVALKWPNDVMYGGAKLAGILVDVDGDVRGPLRAIVGSGSMSWCRTAWPTRSVMTVVSCPAASSRPAAGARSAATSLRRR